MKHFFSFFTILFTSIIILSFLQLGSLGASIGIFAAQTVRPTLTPQPTQDKVIPTIKPIIEQEPVRFVIEKAQIDVQVFTYENNMQTWELLPHSMMYMDNTGTVSEEKNNIILYTKESIAGMNELKWLSEEYDIIVYSNSYKAVYSLQSASVSSTEIENILAPSEKPELTLLICSDSCSEERFVIKAVLKEIQEIK